MPDKILDYAIGPIGRSILIARAGNTRPRGMPSNTIPYPTGVDTESMLLEIPVSEMYENTYCILLSSNKDMEETYELFDRGALQFIRPEHAANPHDPPMKRTNQVHVKSGEYFRHGNLNEPEDKLQLTILNGGDSFQYGRHPYMHVKNTLQKAGYPVSNLSIDQPQESTKAAVFTFEYADNEYYIQPRLDPQILTVNFRFFNRLTDEISGDGTQVVPVLFDVVNCRVNTARERWIVDDRSVAAIHIIVTLGETKIPERP